MKITRRKMLVLSASVATVGITGMWSRVAMASAEDTQKAIAEFAGGEPKAGRIALSVPEIAENGNTVPVEITVESPMSADDYVQSVAVYADGNPNPGIATFHFTPLSGQAKATTRIRLAKTQNVIVVAKMSDGSSFIDTKQVKVTIGGCGG